MSGDTSRTHKFHASAHIVAGRLHLPLDQEIHHQEQATLPEEGGYLSQHSVRYNVEGVLSFHKAYTQVAGHKDVKPGHGWTTVATSVIEQLNILEIVTADRVVGQISTEHPQEGYVPIVTFLGTRFENLRIAGHPVKVEMDPFILGPKPENDGGYRGHPDFHQRVTAQYDRLRGFRDVPNEINERYNRVPSTVEEPLECSLVTHTEGSFPGRCFGHVLDVPHFGKVYLAVLRVEESQHHPETKSPQETLLSLTMVEAQMGCLAHGNVTAVHTVVNGNTKP
jgi:hypothetical protein